MKRIIGFFDTIAHEELPFLTQLSVVYEEDGKLSPVDTEAENKIIEEMLKTLSETSKIKYGKIDE